MPQIRRLLIFSLVAVLALSAAMLIRDHEQGIQEENAFKELAARVLADTQPSPASPIGVSTASTASSASSAPPSSPTAPVILAQYRTLHEQNPDMAGWIKIDGTSIDYPVMHTPGDGDFYLNHSFDRKSSSSGVPFIDQRCAVEPFGTNTIVYSHHMKNSTMFAGLMRYEDEGYYQDHPIIRFDTLYEQHQYEIVAVFRSQAYRKSDTVFKHYNFLNAESPEDFDAYFANIQALELYDTGMTASYGDELLTLVTCDYHTKNGQFVVLSKKLKYPAE